MDESEDIKLRDKNIFSKGFFHRECVAVSEEEDNSLIGFSWKSSSLKAQNRMNERMQ